MGVATKSKPTKGPDQEKQREQSPLKSSASSGSSGGAIKCDNEKGSEAKKNQFGKRASVLRKSKTVEEMENIDKMLNKMRRQDSRESETSHSGLLKRCCGNLSESLTWQKFHLPNDKWIWWPVLVPDCRPTFIWEIAGLFFIFFELISIPYRISFNSPAMGRWKYMENLAVCFFLCDMMLQFVQGFFQHGLQVMEPVLIIRRYMQRWFWIDFVASFPWVWVF